MQQRTLATQSISNQFLNETAFVRLTVIDGGRVSGALTSTSIFPLLVLLNPVNILRLSIYCRLRRKNNSSGSVVSILSNERSGKYFLFSFVSKIVYPSSA